MIRRRITATSMLAAVWLIGLMGQQPATLEIVSPLDGAFVSDQVTIEARIRPQERSADVTDVSFFVDGKLLCRAANLRQPQCPWDAGAVIRPHAIRVVATLASGERLVATTRTQEVDVAESVDVQVVQVNASVQDGGGNFVTGLTRERFRVTESGQPQKVIHFGAEETPLELVIAVDISASMEPAIPDLRAAARQFLDGLKAVDRVTLVAFNSEMFVLTRREAAPAVRDRALDLLRAFGSTSLYDVIIRSIELLSRQTGRRALIVFSDGDDRSSQAKLDQVEQTIKSSDATVFMVGLGRGRDQRTLKQRLTSLAEPSGGRAIFAERPAELGRAFGTILEALKHQYLLGFAPANSARDGVWRPLTVEVIGLNNARVRAREGYFAPRP